MGFFFSDWRVRHEISQPFFRSSKQAWYLQIGKRQLSLGRDRKEALRRYEEIKLHDLHTVPAFPSRLKVAQVCDLFLEWSLEHHEPPTYDFYRWFRQGFCRLTGSLPVTQLQRLHVTRWLKGKGWNDTTQNRAISCIKRNRKGVGSISFGSHCASESTS